MGDVSDWLHLQFVLASSGVEQERAYWICLYACDGERADHSHLELARTVHVESSTACSSQSSRGRTTVSRCATRQGGQPQTTRRRHLPLLSYSPQNERGESKEAN